MNQTDSPEARASRTKAIPITALIGAGTVAVVALLLAISMFRPSVSPAATPIAGIPDGLLPAGSLITVTGDAVPIRYEPSTDAAIVTTMSAGDFAYVVESMGAGPVTNAGYDWYAVEYAIGKDIWPLHDTPSGDLVGGWMAAGSASDRYRFVELSEVECSNEPVTLERLEVDITPWERLVCLSGGQFTIEGSIDGCSDCGSVTPGVSPPWLTDTGQQPPIKGQHAYYPFVRLSVPPGARAPANRDIIRATFHVDDPAAATCTYTDPGLTIPAHDYDYDPVAFQTYCREQLVLESFEVIGIDNAGG